MRLFQMHYSPWSERARWALDHHHLTFEKVEHVPVLGGPLLRAATRRPLGRLSVPLLVDGETVVLGSLEIARFAEAQGSGEPLFPPGEDEAIERWNQTGEVLLEAGRILITRKVIADPEAQRESTPSFVPEALKGAVASGSGMVAALLARKYGFSGVSDATARAQAREGLLTLRAALSSGRNHLLGDRFSYADLLMAASLQFLRPVADLYMPIGPATRRCWSNPDLAEEFADLLAWRDRIYAEHRKLGRAHARARGNGGLPAHAHGKGASGSLWKRWAACPPPGKGAAGESPLCPLASPAPPAIPQNASGRNEEQRNDL